MNRDASPHYRLTHTHPQSFTLSLTYPVHFARGVFDETCDILTDVLQPRNTSGRTRALVIIDGGVHQAFPSLFGQIQSWFGARAKLELVRDPVIVAGGEDVKNDYRGIMHLLDMMMEYRLCRHSYVIVIGGGALLDAAGFATALCHRGLRLIRMPSTTLAQDDAGVGVKNGINLHGGKNTVGTFAAPYAVVNDLNFLSGQSSEHWIGGVSEAFKVAIIKDPNFFEELCKLAPRLGQRDEEALARVVIRCAEIHLDHIATSGDPFELGSARPLDFGHWSAHKLESLSQYKISHGHAVALGIAIDCLYASRHGWCGIDDTRRVLQALQDCGFKLDAPELKRRLPDGQLALLQGLEEFREHLGGELCLAMPDGIGSVREVHEIDTVVMEQCLHDLQSWTQTGSLPLRTRKR